jgi:hypothetical protein
MQWRIYGREDGHDYGVYSGGTPQEAILAMMVDTGYDGPVDPTGWLYRIAGEVNPEKKDTDTVGDHDDPLSGNGVVRLTQLARAAGISPNTVTGWARAGFIPEAYRYHQGRGWWFIRLDDAVRTLARWEGFRSLDADLWRQLAERISHGTDSAV